jgi:hypothetical protein
MVNYDAELYVYPQEVWDAKQCEKAAKHRARDGLGTPYPFLGYIGSSQYGIERYNGGTIINDEWYQGVNRPLPKVAKGFELVLRPTWGWQIIKTI